jgi:hypothetical protein
VGEQRRRRRCLADPSGETVKLGRARSAAAAGRTVSLSPRRLDPIGRAFYFFIYFLIRETKENRHRGLRLLSRSALVPASEHSPARPA